MRGFENNLINQLDRRDMNEREHPMIKEMYPVAKDILSKSAFDPKSFIGHYSQESVEKDIEKIERLKSTFAPENAIKRTSEVFEALIYQHAELSEWLGSNAETIRTSEYDDIINGIDLIVEFTDAESSKHLALGVDVTFGTREIREKFERIKAEIDKNELAEVKYFDSHNITGRLKQLPRVVVGVEMDTVISLAALWYRKKNEELANHFVRDILVQEITIQLEKYLQYAEEIGSNDAVRSYRQALATIRGLNEKVMTRSAEDRTAIETDRVFADIKRHLELFKRSAPLPDTTQL